MHIKKINFFINGQQYYTYNYLTLQKVLNYFNCKNNIFVIEYNNMICNQKNWKNLKICNNDKIEIITIVGGG